MLQFLSLLFSVRIESSGPKFCGFAVQARESTESFTRGAKFVGEFVNPPVNAEWRIWHCAAVSINNLAVTHIKVCILEHHDTRSVHSIVGQFIKSKFSILYAAMCHTFTSN